MPSPTSNSGSSSCGRLRLPHTVTNCLPTALAIGHRPAWSRRRSLPCSDGERPSKTACTDQACCHLKKPATPPDPTLRATTKICHISTASQHHPSMGVYMIPTSKPQILPFRAGAVNGGTWQMESQWSINMECCKRCKCMAMTLEKEMVT